MIFQGVLEAFKAVSARRTVMRVAWGASWWICLGVQKHEPSWRKGWAGDLEWPLWSLLYQSEQTLFCCHFAYISNGNRHSRVLLFSQSSLLLSSVTTHSPVFFSLTASSQFLFLAILLSLISNIKCLRSLSLWVSLSFYFPIFSL